MGGETDEFEEVLMEVTCCDLCRQKRELREAIGWYKANDDKKYDVCEEHAKDAKVIGFELILY